MNRTLWRILALAGAAVIVALMMRTYAQVREGGEEEQEEAIKAPSRVSVQNGQPIITLDPETESRMGITISRPTACAACRQITAPAVVLSAQDLVTARDKYVAAQTALEKAQASVQAIEQEADRLRALYEDNQNASQKALQSAESSLHAGQADVQAARQDLALQAAALQQSWGDVVGKWVVDGPPPLDRVFNQSDFFVQVTVPVDIVSAAPKTISLELPGSGQLQAQLISTFPRVDPRIQGASLLYLTQNYPGLAPGLTLAAHLPLGQPMRGVLVPQRAIVRWQGSTWVYEEVSSGHFVRREIPTDTLLAGGVLVSRAFTPRDLIVTSGAQALLSEEFRSQIQPED
jgi:hypothetical protein